MIDGAGVLGAVVQAPQDGAAMGDGPVLAKAGPEGERHARSQQDEQEGVLEQEAAGGRDRGVE